jgi:hypothetical protein
MRHCRQVQILRVPTINQQGTANPLSAAGAYNSSRLATAIVSGNGAEMRVLHHVALDAVVIDCSDVKSTGGGVVIGS